MLYRSKLRARWPAGTIGLERQLPGTQGLIRFIELPSMFVTCVQSENSGHPFLFSYLEFLDQVPLILGLVTNCLTQSAHALQRGPLRSSHYRRNDGGCGTVWAERVMTWS